MFPSGKTTLFHHATHAVIPHHVHVNGDHSSSEKMDYHQQRNNNRSTKNVTVENWRDDIASYSCKNAGKKILASSITYKDPTILKAFGRNKIR